MVGGSNLIWVKDREGVLTNEKRCVSEIKSTDDHKSLPIRLELLIKKT